jgi:hypothetical protein
MNEQSKHPRENSDTKSNVENHKTEKDRMDYEGGNQGKEDVSNNKASKSRNAGHKKIPDGNSESSTNAEDQRSS